MTYCATLSTDIFEEMFEQYLIFNYRVFLV